MRSSFLRFLRIPCKNTKKKGGSAAKPLFGPPFTIPSLSPGGIPSMSSSALAMQGNGNRYSQHSFDLRTATVRLRRGEGSGWKSARPVPSVTQKFLRVTQHSASTFFGRTIGFSYHFIPCLYVASTMPY
jgi:hypothetical protein